MAYNVPSRDHRIPHGSGTFRTLYDQHLSSGTETGYSNLSLPPQTDTTERGIRPPILCGHGISPLPVSPCPTIFTYCDCFNSNVPLYEGGFDPPTRICGSCAAQAVAQTSPQPPEPAPPPERPSKEPLLASIPSPKTLVAHLDQFVIGQAIAKRRLALGVSNHYKRLVDTWDRGAPDPIIADADLRDVVVEKSNILLIGPSGSGKTHLVKSLASYLNVPAGHRRCDQSH